MTTVIKIGGARAVDPAGAVADIAERVDAGERIVIVHGGSTAVDDLLEALGESPEYVTTPRGVTGRFTDEKTMEVFSMAMAGKVNTELTVTLQNAGVNAVGLSGVDGALMTGPRKSAVRVIEDGKKKIRRGDHSGRIETVNVELLETLLAGGYTPVISVPMLADDGVAVNADADRAGAAVAAALGASLVLLTDVAGVYADPDDPASRIDTATSPDDFDALETAAEGFMTRKIMAAREALDGGATAVFIADGTRSNPVSQALEGDATKITSGALKGGAS